MEGDTVTMQDLFHFEQTGVDEDGHVLGEMKSTGVVPTFLELFEHAGVDMDTAYPFSQKWA